MTNARTGEVEKISKPLTVIGKKQVDADGIGAGDIGAVAKLVSAKTGDTLCDASRVVKMPAPVFPLPSLFMAVTVAKKGDEGKISSALARLMEEDPTLSYREQRRDPPADHWWSGRAAPGCRQGQAEEQVRRGDRPGSTPHRLP